MSKDGSRKTDSNIENSQQKDIFRVEITGYTSNGARIKNPYASGPEEIHAEGPELSLDNIGDPIEIEIKNTAPLGPPKIEARVVKPPMEVKNKASAGIYSSDREEGTEWSGTPQGRSDGAKLRRELINTKDLRGDKNSLLNGDQ
jgi:hypothetical protein